MRLAPGLLRAIEQEKRQQSHGRFLGLGLPRGGKLAAWGALSCSLRAVPDHGEELDDDPEDSEMQMLAIVAERLSKVSHVRNVPKSEV
ncbi:MAG: hypothetical protein SGPRY_010684 [Prymnesium sp.]